MATVVIWWYWGDIVRDGPRYSVDFDVLQRAIEMWQESCVEDGFAMKKWQLTACYMRREAT